MRISSFLNFNGFSTILGVAATKPSEKKTDRDVEAANSVKQTVAKLRRLANGLESNKPFTIQVVGERIRLPATAVFNVEHERECREEGLEFQFKWTH